MNKFTFLRILPFFCAMLLLTHSGWGQATVFYWDFDNEDKRTAVTDAAPNDISLYTADAGTGTLNLVGGPVMTGWVLGAVGTDPQAPNSNGWDDGEGTKYWMVTTSTTGFTSLKLSSIQRGSNTGPRDFKVQYSTDGTNWTDIPDANISVANNFTSGVLDEVELPEASEDHETLYLRWIMTSNTRVDGTAGVGSAGTNRIDGIHLIGQTDDPILTSDPNTVTSMNYVLDNGPSDARSFELTGINLDGTDVTITAPPNFEVSQNETTGFGAGITLTAYDGSSETIWVRLEAGLAVDDYSGNISISGGGADDVQVAVSGKVIEPFQIPYVNAFRTEADVALAMMQGFTLNETVWGGTAGGGYTRIGNGGNIESPTIDFTAFEALEVTMALTTFGGNTGQELSIQVSADNGTTYTTVSSFSVPDSYEDFSAIVDLREDFNAENGKLKFAMTAGTNQIRFRDLDIKPYEFPEDPALISIPAAITSLNYVLDNGPSDAQSFELTGINLDGTDVTITAPDNFEVSQSETTGFVEVITLTAYDGSSETIWVRLEAGLAVDDYSGNISISGGGADDVQVAVSGTVTGPLVTELPFATDFGIADNWNLLTAAGTYGAKEYVEGGWYFHSTHGIRASDDKEVFEESNHSFRERGDFTVYNQAPLSGMTGFSFQFRHWMTSPGLDRDFRISLDGGTSWTTIETINRDWFEEGFDGPYEKYIYYFDQEQSFDAEEFRIEILGGNNNNNGRINIGQFKALDDDPPPPNPVFEPVAGIYFEDQFVFVDNYPDYDPGVNVYYTTDGSVPGTGSSLHDDNTGILLTAGDGAITLRAIAIEGDRQSGVTTAVYVFPVDVATIAELRGQPGGDEIYRLTGEAVLTFQHPFRNQKFIQDATAAIKIDDSGGVIEQVYEVGDGIVNITGTLGSFFNMLQFVPVVDPPEANSKGNVIEPLVITLDEIESDHQAQLVQVARVSFDASGDFAPVISYAIFDPSGEGIFRTPNSLAALDYFGTPIPETPVNITAVVEQFGSDMQITARDLEDFEEIELILSKFTVGGIDVLSLPRILVNDPGDRGAFLYIADFEGVTGIVLETATLGVQYIVTVNGVEIPHQDLPTLPIEVGDVIFVTVIPAEKDAEIQYYKVTATDRDPAAIPIPAWAVLFAGLLMGLFIFLRKFR